MCSFTLPAIELRMNMPEHALLRLGTSAFSNPSWVGVFYPPGTQPADYLACYAARFNCVEVDNTFYRIPSVQMVHKWYSDTPKEFVFAAKVPQIITHEKVLVDCQEDLTSFLNAIGGLKEKLGPLLLQFPYFNKAAFPSGREFLARLKPFLSALPRDFRWALEIRNKFWITPALLDLLRENRVAFAQIDQSWMPRIGELLRKFDLDTAEFAYIRWLGDRKGIEEITKSWDVVVVDREENLKQWVKPVKDLLGRRRAVYGFFNNHYSGHAPASLEMFLRLLGSECEPRSVF
jgi:uncharacterized protein YecE (DUF72 family)